MTSVARELGLEDAARPSGSRCCCAGRAASRDWHRRALRARRTPPRRRRPRARRAAPRSADPELSLPGEPRRRGARLDLSAPTARVRRRMTDELDIEREREPVPRARAACGSSSAWQLDPVTQEPRPAPRTLRVRASATGRRATDTRARSRRSARRRCASPSRRGSRSSCPVAGATPRRREVVRENSLAHDLRGGALPEHGRVLGQGHRDLPDPR